MAFGMVTFVKHSEAGSMFNGSQSVVFVLHLHSICGDTFSTNNMPINPEEVIEETRKFTSKQLAVIIGMIVGAVTGTLFIEDRYAKTKETKAEIEATRGEIKRINEEMKVQVTTLSVLLGQMSAILNSGSGRVVAPIKLPEHAPPLTPEVLSQIERDRPKVEGNDAAVILQNDILKQQAAVTNQQKRLESN